ncbi:MAG TPA: UDP-N-acetylmuramoyl-L-alanyl-D-glutamate--2,6-diaminopimelate ligase [Dongiaceae bacterium]|nr:UDP-N-acetylmuramoyl-L-alanyl-D-glutamate--2,6-diaminopimelate ligase [Dongiaceae bacterium]
MRLNDLMSGIDDLRLVAGAGDVTVRSVALDSRKVKAGALFAALPGQKVEGAAFAAAAAAAGAVAILAPADSKLPALPGDVAVIEAKEPRRALALIASRFFARQPQTIAAVTGTGGKTSTVAFTRQLWSLEGREAASLGTLGVISKNVNDPGSLTTPDTVALHEWLARLADAGITNLAMEASSHGLDQHRLDGVRVTAAAFTNLSQDHLDYHQTMEAYFAAKLRLFAELLPEGGTAVINARLPQAQSLINIARQRRQQPITFGGAGSDIALRKLRPTPQGQVLEIELFGQKRTTEFPVAGGFQAENLLAALGLVIGTGSDADKIIGLVSRLSGVPGRIEHVADTPGGGAVYVDYAHKPGALEAVLGTLRPHAAKRLIVVFGCGGDRDRGKRPIMGEIATRLADRVIVTDDNPRSEVPAAIRAEILAKAPGAIEVGDRAEAIRLAMHEMQPGDLLVIAGKGHETYQIVGDKTYPFDDAAVARQVAQELGAEKARVLQ